jgi:hypothetical protein
MTIGRDFVTAMFIALRHPDSGCLPMRYRPRRSKHENVAAFTKSLKGRLTKARRNCSAT